MDSITKQLEEIANEICDNYCKYPNEIADDNVLKVICNRCPLNKLEVKE